MRHQRHIPLLEIYAKHSRAADAMRSAAVPKTAARPVIIPDAYIALPLVKPPVRYEMVRFRCGLQLRARHVIKSWCLSFINATRRAGLCQYRAAPLVRFNVKHHQSSVHPWCKKENEGEREKERERNRGEAGRVHPASLHFGFYISFAYFAAECASTIHWCCMQIGIIKAKRDRCCEWLNFFCTFYWVSSIVEITNDIEEFVLIKYL